MSLIEPLCQHSVHARLSHNSWLPSLFLLLLFLAATLWLLFAALGPVLNCFKDGKYRAHRRYKRYCPEPCKLLLRLDDIAGTSIIPLDVGRVRLAKELNLFAVNNHRLVVSRVSCLKRPRIESYLNM